MHIELTLENGYLPDIYGKYAAPEFQIEGHPKVSFPFKLSEVPANARSLALTFLDWDAIPVGGFCWIHWTAANIDPATVLMPENASALESLPMIQGANSDWSPLAGSYSDPTIIHRYAGPCPPDKDHKYSLTVYALDTMLDLHEGFFLNELLWAIEGHVLDCAVHHMMSRA